MVSKQLLCGFNNLFKQPFSHHTRHYRPNPFPNYVYQYLYRAKLIDSIRIALRSDSDSDLQSILGDEHLDTFVVCNAICSAPSADAALSFVDALKTVPLFTHNKHSLGSLASVLAKSNRRAELKALINDVYAEKFSGVSFSFLNLMRWHSEAGDLNSLLRVWEEYRVSSEHQVCSEPYNLVMRVYAQKGNNSEAVNTFYRMIDEGVIPDFRTYDIMIKHVASSGNLFSAMEIFFLLPSMRIKRTYSQYLLLVDGFVGVGMYDRVKDLLEEMRVDGILPGRAMRLSLERMCEAGFAKECDELLLEMATGERIKSIEYCSDDSGSDDEDGDKDDDDNKGDDESQSVRLKPWLDPRELANTLLEWSPEEISALESAGFVWTSRLFCKVIRYFKSPELAWKFFYWVACQPGFTHDIYSVQRTMILLARHGKVDLVDKLMSKIRSEGMELSFSSVRLIIDFFGLSNNGAAALKVFQYSRDLCGPISKFNLMVLYSSVLRALTRCRMDSDTMNLLNEMISQSIHPDIQTFTGLMHSFAYYGDIKLVHKVFALVKRIKVKPDGFMYTQLIQDYCKCGNGAHAWTAFEDLWNLNLIPDTETKELLLNRLWKERKRKEVALLEESCQGMSSIHPIRLRGQVWTVSSANLSKVFEIYSDSFRSNKD